MDFDERYGTEKVLEQEGAWITLSEGENGEPDTEVMVARWGKNAHRKYLHQLMQPHRRIQQQGATIPDSIMRPILRKSAAKHILKGWKGIEMSGKDFPYSEDNALALLENEDFMDEIIEIAGYRHTFQKEVGEAEAKN